MDAELLHIDNWLIDLSTGDTWLFTSSHEDLASSKPNFRLGLKSVELIKTLSSKPGEVFSKDSLIESIWPNTIVTDDALARSISRLRKSLNDDAKSPRIIETVPKRGYRLIAVAEPYKKSEQQVISPPVANSEDNNRAFPKNLINPNLI